MAAATPAQHQRAFSRRFELDCAAAVAVRQAAFRDREGRARSDEAAFGVDRQQLEAVGPRGGPGGGEGSEGRRVRGVRGVEGERRDERSGRGGVGGLGIAKTPRRSSSSASRRSRAGRILGG